MLKQLDKVKRLLFVLLIVSLSAGCFAEELLSTTSGAPTDTSLVSGKSGQWGDAPDFTALKVGGGEFTLSSLQGKVILLHSWSVDCPFCKMQIPIFIELYKKYNNAGLEIVGVCFDRENVVKSFTKLTDMNYILILAKWEILRKYRDLRFLPATFIIDRQGNIVEKYTGYTSKEILEKEMKKLL